MAKIVLKNLTKKWKDFYGAKNINLTIEDKEFLVLLGPSGCGKTTTMRMIAGLEDPSGGEIWIGDKKVNNLQPKDRDIAMVFQSYGLYPHLSTYENIRFPLKMRKIPKIEHKEQVLKAAKMVEMEDFLHRKPRALSGGQKQRVALARAMVREPNCFLMDEPLSNLDAKLRATMRAELKHLQHKLQTTTVFVTHDQVEAMTLADRVAIMRQGEIRQIGAPEEIYNKPRDTFVASFIGSPAMNLIKGQISKGKFISGNIKLPVPPKFINGLKNKELKCYLGIRAENIIPLSPSEAGAAKDVIKSTIYSSELLGESSLITVKESNGSITAKHFGNFKGKIGDPVALKVKVKDLYYFDIKSGERIFPL